MAKTKYKEIIIHAEHCTGCRICQLMCSSIYKQRFCPAEAFIQIDDAYELSPKIYFTDDCILCGQCAKHCLYGALELKEVEE